MDKRKISIILAAVLALIAVVMVRNYISQTEKKYIKEEKKAYVVLATQPIALGSVIDESMLRIEAVPEKYVQPNAISSPSLAAGKRALAPIATDEQIMTTKLTLAASKDMSLAMSTPPGKRAITITIPPLAAVAGKIRPRDYVDVIGTFPYNAQVDGRTVTEMVSVTLFQNVLVLSVEGGAGMAERGKPAPAPSDLVIMLALSPREAALLSFALEQKASLRLVLRPTLETAVEPVPPVEVNALWQYVFSNLGQEFIKDNEPAVKPQDKKQEPPAPPTLEVYRGTERSNMPINK